jgi:hypothetical protein
VVAPRTPSPRPTPVASPTTPELAPLLYLAAEARLLDVATVEGSVTVPRGGRPVGFGLHVRVDTPLHGTPRLALYHQLLPRHGNGLPKATVHVDLLDCRLTCRVLSPGAAVLTRTHDGWVRQVVPLSAVDTVLPAGDDLRVAVSLVSRQNVSGIVLGYGGSTPSGLLLG